MLGLSSDPSSNMEPVQERAIQLLRDIEAREGRLRLDKGTADIDHGDPGWSSGVFGEWAREFENRVAETRLSMSDSPILRALKRGVELLDKNAAAVLDAVPVGWTSVPVLNACAVRRKQATAIALNIRLSTTLASSAAINLDLQEAMARGKSAEASVAFNRLKTILQCSADQDFDVALADVCPYPTRFHSWFGSCCSHLQLLFVLLHEIGHVALGHFAQEELWLGHPLSRPTSQFFSSSIEAEYAADAYAASRLLDLAKWEAASTAVEFLGLSRKEPALVPLAIVELFVWFHLLAPSNMHSYYEIPQTHPHPLDRAQRIVDTLDGRDRLLDAPGVGEALARYRRLIQLEP